MLVLFSYGTVLVGKLWEEQQGAYLYNLPVVKNEVAVVVIVIVVIYRCFCHHHG